MSDEISLETGPEYQPQKRMLSWLVKYKDFPIPTEDERKLYPYNSANILSKIFFTYVTPILRVGYSRTIRPDDLYTLTDDLNVVQLTEKFNVSLQKRIDAAKQEYDELQDPEVKSKPFKLPEYTIAKTVISTLRKDIITSTILGAITLIFMSLTPLLLKQLITFVEDDGIVKQNIGQGVGYAIGCALALGVTGLLFTHFLNIGSQLGIKTKSILTSVVLQKAFKLLPAAKRNIPLVRLQRLSGLILPELILL